MSMETSSRENILTRLREAARPDMPHPPVKRYEIPGDRIENFKRKLTGFDGQYMEFPTRQDAIDWLAANFDLDNLKVYSSVPGVDGNVASPDVKLRHFASDIDVCIGESVLGVGETGSCYVTDESLGVRAMALLCTDLYLLLAKENICDGLQTAYDMIDFSGHVYGSFFTGPSATADIEAVHITGAQGEISLTVLLY